MALSITDRPRRLCLSLLFFLWDDGRIAVHDVIDVCTGPIRREFSVCDGGKLVRRGHVILILSWVVTIIQHHLLMCGYCFASRICYHTIMDTARVQALAVCAYMTRYLNAGSMYSEVHFPMYVLVTRL
jgi:hypothetical protein